MAKKTHFVRSPFRLGLPCGMNTAYHTAQFSSGCRAEKKSESTFLGQFPGSSCTSIDSTTRVAPCCRQKKKNGADHPFRSLGLYFFSQHTHFSLPHTSSQAMLEKKKCQSGSHLANQSETRER